MGIQVEFNPDLALRDYSEYEKGKREIDECVPKKLVVGKTYNFLKKGQRNYWLMGELPLLVTRGDGQLSYPIASIKILEVKHFLKNNTAYTSGKYKVVQLVLKDEIIFNGYGKVR